MDKLAALERAMQSDVILIYGPIYEGLEIRVRDLVEELKSRGKDEERESDTLSVVLSTPGGSAETVERIVEILRNHYSNLWMVVPDQAMSAGTIFAMAGNRIFMDYYSCLGPIDPQVYNGKDWVPALGYLDQVELMIEKSRNNCLSEAELMMLNNLDLAMLTRYEQAKNLTITLLKSWLVKYKFHDWTVHRSNPNKTDQPVTEEEKQTRAEEIAKKLSDNKLWHSHGRSISKRVIEQELRLKIDEYTNDKSPGKEIREYSDYMIQFLKTNNLPSVLHSRYYL